MKRSEFLKRAAALPLFRQGVEEDFIRLCEEAGTPFDPEEEALPERLYFLESDSGEDWISTAPPRLIGHAIAQAPRHYPPYEFRRSVLREAVRRFNLFPRIAAAFKQWQAEDYGKDSDDNFGEHLEAILYGKEG